MGTSVHLLPPEALAALDAPTPPPPPPPIDVPENAPPPPGAPAAAPLAPMPPLVAQQAHASITPKEVLIGGLSVLGADVFSLGLGLGITLGACAAGCSGGGGGAIVVLFALSFGLSDFVLAPLAAALGVNAADGWGYHGQGILMSAVGAYGLQLAGNILLGLIIASLSSTAGPAIAMLEILGLVVHYVGLPLAAAQVRNWVLPAPGPVLAPSAALAPSAPLPSSWVPVISVPLFE